MATSGSFILSLDFELYWGMYDHSALEKREELLHTTRRLIPQLLELLKRYEIHATWATVGILFAETGEELEQYRPECIPKYQTTRLNPYLNSDWPARQASEADSPTLFAASLINSIAEYPHQEIGSHTFSHFYCLEEGFTVESFKADLEQAISIAKSRGINLESLVFPRNQYTDQHIATAYELGIRQVRTQPDKPLLKPRNRQSETKLIRVLRGLDAYISLSRENGLSVSAMKHENNCTQIPATLFLRPIRKRPTSWANTIFIDQLYNTVDALHLNRIKKCMRRAALDGNTFHLWFHPHNLALDERNSLQRLEKIFIEFDKLRGQYGFRSQNMSEVGREADSIV